MKSMFNKNVSKSNALNFDQEDSRKFAVVASFYEEAVYGCFLKDDLSDVDDWGISIDDNDADYWENHFDLNNDFL